MCDVGCCVVPLFLVSGVGACVPKKSKKVIHGLPRPLILGGMPRARGQSGPSGCWVRGRMPLSVCGLSDRDKDQDHAARASD